MHNAAFAELGIDARYLAFDVPPASLGAAIEGARALGVRQLAISIPHKEAVIPLLDEVDAEARTIGAVNTVTRDAAGKLCGSNTDWLGGVRALERETGIAGKRAVVLGAGGTARALTYGLKSRGAEVTVLNRTQGRAQSLADELGARAGVGLEALASLDAEIVVNTTSVGLREDRSPVAANALREGSVVLDAVYDPPHTRLLQDAAACGARTVGGKWMLVYQAAAQLEKWTGESAPVEVMADAFDAA